MISVQVKKVEQVPVKYLRAECGVRYWEDATVNGVEDEDGSLIPLRDGDSWNPVIELETGVIQGWPDGTEADLCYKVCDDGVYYLVGEDGNVVSKRAGYVPSMMCPAENGFGDYIIMKIDGSGKIENWKADLSSFDDEDDED